jgi:hypothetical protein
MSWTGFGNEFTFQEIRGLYAMQWCAKLQNVVRSLFDRVAPSVSAGAAALVGALWVATCAAAFEFIWRGLRIFLRHPSLESVLSMLLIAVVLVFFVEPLLERARDLLESSRHHRPAEPRPRSLLFTASVSMAFALTSICLHEAMSAFVSGHHAEGAADSSGLAAGIELTTAWAMVPFFVAVAWQGARSRWLAVPTGIVGASSAAVAGWLFAWGPQTVISTTLPCLLIQYFGYRQIARQPMRDAFARCAPVVACVAAAWLLAASLFDALLSIFGLDWLKLYDFPDWLVDVRFYLGWAIGLLLAPFPPERERKTA